MVIRELAQIRKEHKRELEYEKFDGYELPPRTQFSMLNKPAVSIKYGVMKFNMACIRLFEGIKYVLPILHPNKKRLALIMCPEEDSAYQRLESGERNILTSSFGLACRVIEALDMDASKFYHGDYYLEELKTIEGKRFGDRGKHQFK